MNLVAGNSMIIAISLLALFLSVVNFIILAKIRGNEDTIDLDRFIYTRERDLLYQNLRRKDDEIEGLRSRILNLEEKVWWVTPRKD